MHYRILILLTAISILSACGGSAESDGLSPQPDTGDTPATPDTTPNPIPNPSPDLPTVSAEKSNHAFESTHFSGSENCSRCHDGLEDQSGNDISIVKDWKTSMMANSARDPFWKAMVASEVSRNSAIGDVIEQKCSRCHTPMANVEASFAGEASSLLGDGFLSSSNPHFDKAADGVSCVVCHQIENTPEFGTEAGTSGNFVIAENQGSDRKIYGPFVNPNQGPMINNVGFTPEHSLHTQDSALCGSCHDVTTPVVSVEGEVTGAYFPEQMVYSEWGNSAFSQGDNQQSCQACHMPLADGEVPIATRPRNSPARDHFSQHQFVGANSVMLDILQNNASQLGLSVTDFSKTISRTRTMLQSAALLSIENMEIDEDQLSFHVRVVNNSGHKFPSGFPSRRAWLHVTVYDSENNVVFESGAIDAAGQITGVNADTDATQYERHHDVITSADQVQVYESIMGNTNGEVNYTLLNGSSYLKDNRLMPQGMDKANAPAKIAVYGDAASDDDFIAGEDVVSYQLSGLNDEPYRVKAILNYQTIAYAFSRDLFKNESGSDLVNTFKEMYDKANFRYEEVVRTEASMGN